MFVFERVAYSLIYTPDVYGIIAVSAMLAATLVWFTLSKEKLEVRSIAKMLILASTLFTFIWLVFAAIVRTLYGFIVLASWILLFFVSLYVLKKKRRGGDE